MGSEIFMIQILDTGISTAEENMRFDEKLLEHLASHKDPILHLYQWKRPSATYGYFIRPENHLDFEHVARYDIDLARRPTGGGIVFHIWDLAFSFFMPSEHPAFFFNTLGNYEFVNQAVLKTVQDYFSLEPELVQEDAPSLVPDSRNFCMAQPSQYDVIYKGMKVAGAAQRRQKAGYLHQGTISLFKPDVQLLEEVLLSPEIVKAMTAYTFAPVQDPQGLQQVREDLQKLLADNLERSLKSTAHA